MKTLSISEIVKNPAKLKAILGVEPVRIVWKEQKPNGDVIFSAIAKKEDSKNVRNVQ